MTTKFKIEINGNGSELNSLVQMCANHNEGTAKITIDILEGYLQAQLALLPLTRKGMVVKHENNAPETIHVSDNNGKTFYLTITECTYEELKTEEVNQNAEILN